MTKGGGKGRISNALVAASFAAVLTVYAAGYWRTREEARRMDARAQERRPVRTVPAPAPTPAPAPVTNVAAVPEPPAASPAPPPAPLPPAASPSAALPLPAQAQLAQPVASQPAPPSTPEPGAPAPALAAPTAAVTADIASAALPDPPPDSSAQWRDGTYTGWGTSRHGDIKAQVVIRNGRIVEASIASCETRYPCDVIGHIVQQPVARQSPDVDRVSRATESADAYYYGLVEALKEAQIPPDGDVAAPVNPGVPGAG